MKYPEDLIDKVVVGDCREIMGKLPADSVDAIVTDPPYELGFMGKSWDSSGIAYSPDVWSQALRIMKPGAHLLAFGGTRTYHRMACAIEDAGFEIRDQLQWIYGSGFPKSLDVSKAIDKASGIEPTKVRKIKRTGKKEGCLGAFSGNNWETKPTGEEAKLWHGWGTALKPANEPIVLARKPFSEKTVAANVLKWGTGALNIDACRLDAGIGDLREGEKTVDSRYSDKGGTNFAMKPGPRCGDKRGRWPANVILDEEAGRVLDEQGGNCKAGGNLSGTEPSRTGGPGTVAYGEFKDRREWDGYQDQGGASRFFYCAKTSQPEAY